MPVSFGVEPEPEPDESNGTPAQPAKPVTAEKYGPKNPHPDKGIYIKVPLVNVTLDGNAYLGVASTGRLGITNIKFDFKINLGNGEETLTYHAGWGNLTKERDAAFIKTNGLLGKKSGIKVEELPGYTVDSKGITNVTELLGPLKEKT